MRPRKLAIDGYTSFRDRQEVDFGDLELFVITGPTGAGKTSLLDSIALALYGQVPRMSGNRGLAELVSHGQAEARVLLEFSVDGAVYRVSRRLPRKGAQSARLERLEGDRWVDAVERAGVRAVNDKVQELVKLDFASFCKAVVLPQGEFARFLKGEPSERRETLVALLALGSFERMRARANERARELKIRTEQTNKILQGEEFADATPEGLARSEGEAARAEAHARAVAADLARAREAHRLSTEREELATRAADLGDRLEALAGELEAEQTRCREAEEAARKAKVAQGPARELAERAAQEMAAAETALYELTAEKGSVGELTRIRAAAEALPTLLGDVQTAHASLEQLEQARAAAAIARNELQAASVRAEEAAQSAHASRRERQQELTAASEACRALEATVQQLRDATVTRGRTEQALEPARASATREEAEAVEARAASAEIERRLEELQHANMVVTLGARLSVGDLCPICERPLEHQPSSDGHVDAELVQTRDAVADARTAADEAGRRAAGAAARLADAERVHREAQENWQRLASALGGMGAADESMATMRARANEAATALEGAEAAHDQAVTQLGERRQELAATTARLESLAQQHARATVTHDEACARCEAALAQLRDRFGDPVPSDAAARLTAALASVGAAESALAKARADEQAARRALEEATAAVIAADRRLAEIDVRLQELRGRAQASLEVARQVDPEHLTFVLPGPAAARDFRAQELAAWSQEAARQVRAASQRLSDEARAHAANAISAAAGQGIDAADAPEAVAALGESSASAMAAQGSAQQRVAAVSAQLEHRRRLEAEIEEERARAQVLEVLARELRADRFIEFVIQETLDLLAARASEELRRISDGRYSLMSADGQFSVVDHLNADERRSVKTLSGGETFMASLALALALSQHVTDLAGEGLGARLEAVFIDEGFGALDPDTLEEVIDALERLREADLVVGVISHVPQVAARIGEGLEVRRDGSRSVIVDRKAA